MKYDDMKERELEAELWERIKLQEEAMEEYHGPLFKVGDLIQDEQGGRLQIIGYLHCDNNGHVYECITPGTKGEPWLVAEKYIKHCQKVRRTQ